MIDFDPKTFTFEQFTKCALESLDTCNGKTEGSPDKPVLVQGATALATLALASAVRELTTALTQGARWTTGIAPEPGDRATS